MAALERHQKAKHQKISFSCAEFDISKDSRRKLTDHLITHKTFICPNCDKVISLHNKSSHMKICRGQGSKFQCDQCGEATKTAKGLHSHKMKFHQAPSVENKTSFECGYCNFQSKRKWNRDQHEKNCQEKARQKHVPVEPLTREEAVEWFGDLNLTKEDFELILEKIRRKWGKHFLQKGVKVSTFFLFNIPA